MQELHYLKTTSHHMSHSFMEHRSREGGRGTLRHRHTRSPHTQEEEFRSPNQEFTEYLLCFVLRKIAFVFYIVFTIIDHLLQIISRCCTRSGHNPSPPLSSTPCCRSRTTTEDTILSSATTLTESSKTWYTNPKEDWRKEEVDEQQQQQQQQQWGHFTFIE
jgi:hypothetical protein